MNADHAQPPVDALSAAWDTLVDGTPECAEARTHLMRLDVSAACAIALTSGPERMHASCHLGCACGCHRPLADVIPLRRRT